MKSFKEFITEDSGKFDVTVTCRTDGCEYGPHWINHHKYEGNSFVVNEIGRASCRERV